MAHNTGAYLPTSKAHEYEVKVRLTEDGGNELARLAAQLDLKPAALGRMLITSGLRTFKQHGFAFGVAANGLFGSGCGPSELRRPG